jgi:hypothetical protein
VDLIKYFIDHFVDAQESMDGPVLSPADRKKMVFEAGLKIKLSGKSDDPIFALMALLNELSDQEIKVLLNMRIMFKNIGSVTTMLAEAGSHKTLVDFIRGAEARYAQEQGRGDVDPVDAGPGVAMNIPVIEKGLEPVSVDEAEDVGGIDFNDKNLRLERRGDLINLKLPFEWQNIDENSIEGFTPVIINITPVNDWGFWEQYWIDVIKMWGFELTNIANGGRGGNQGIIVNKKISLALLNRKFSDETIEKMRLSAINRKISDGGRKSLSIHRTGSGNPMYGKIRPESSKKYRSVVQSDLNYTHIKTWQGLIIASKELKINRCTISDVCNGRKKTAGGYTWRYTE